MDNTEHWISCDWGSSAFRLRLMNPDGVSAQITTPVGATRLAQSAETSSAGDRGPLFAEYLDQRLGELQARTTISLSSVPVVVSGMVSSAHGWRELPYAAVPFALDGGDIVFERVRAGTDRVVYLLSGVRTERDVMRGEEAEILGLYQLPQMGEHSEDSLLLMPGTHSKHVRVDSARVTDFRTFMTGELFEVLSRHSVLQFTVSEIDFSGGSSASGWEEAFLEGVRDGAKYTLSQRLFTIRTNGLFKRRGPEQNAAVLSGLLIGAEVDDLRRRYTSGPVLLCAGGRIAALYHLALDELGLGARLVTVPEEAAAVLSALGHHVFLNRQRNERSL